MRPFDQTVADHYPPTDDGIHIGIVSSRLLPAEVPSEPSGETVSEVDYIWSTQPPGHATLPAYRATHMDSYFAPTWNDFATTDIAGHSLVWFQINHPDWIAYRCDDTGKPTRTPAWYGYGTPDQMNRVPLDYSNPAVRRYMLSGAEMRLRDGYDGLAFDNVVLNNFQRVCGTYRWTGTNGVKRLEWHALGYPQGSGTNVRLQADLLGFFRFMDTELHRDYPQKTLTANTNLAAAGVPMSTLTPLFDGILDEGGFTGFGRAWPSDDAWQREVEGAESVTEAGKALILVAYTQPTGRSVGPRPDVQELVDWVLANYLLVRGSHTYTYVDRLATTFLDLPQYHLPIGRPTSARYQAQGVQRRDYSGGLVLVNPSSKVPHTVDLGGTFTDAFGVIRQRITLGPTSGAILLNDGP